LASCYLKGLSTRMTPAIARRHSPSPQTIPLRTSGPGVARLSTLLPYLVPTTTLPRVTMSGHGGALLMAHFSRHSGSGRVLLMLQRPPSLAVPPKGSPQNSPGRQRGGRQRESPSPSGSCEGSQSASPGSMQSIRQRKMGPQKVHALDQKALHPGRWPSPSPGQRRRRTLCLRALQVSRDPAKTGPAEIGRPVRRPLCQPVEPSLEVMLEWMMEKRRTPLRGFWRTRKRFCM
jgi:hypothetical protein